MTTALQIKLLAGILAVLGIIAGLIIRGGRPVEVAKPATVEHRLVTNGDEEKEYRRFVAPTTKHKLIP